MNWHAGWQWLHARRLRAAQALVLAVGSYIPIVLHLRGQWLADHRGRALFLLFLFLTSYVPVGLMAAYQVLTLYRENPLLKRVGWLMAGIGMMGVCELLANIDPPYCAGGAVHHSTWNAWLYWSGKACLLAPSLEMWRYVHHPKT